MCHQMTQGGGGVFSKVSRDIFLLILKQNFLVLATSLATFKYEINKNLFDSTRFHTLSQIKLVLAGLGFHVKLQMIKLQ